MNAFDILALGFTAIGCFVTGYLAGSKTSPKEEYARIVKDIRKAATPSGTVNRPSPEAVIERSNPKKMEEAEAFKESFRRDIGDPTAVHQ